MCSRALVQWRRWAQATSSNNPNDVQTQQQNQNVYIVKYGANRLVYKVLYVQ